MGVSPNTPTPNTTAMPTPSLSTTKRLTNISTRHRAALAALQGMGLPPDAQQEVLNLAHAFTALSCEYSNLNDKVGDLLESLER